MPKHGPSPGFTVQKSIAWMYSLTAITRVQRLAMEFLKFKVGKEVYHHHVKILKKG